MVGTKPKSDQITLSWKNQVIKTADGRLLVRGVDFPASAKATTKTASAIKAASAHIKSSPGILQPITNKREAVSIAKKAGLINSVVKSTSEKQNSAKDVYSSTSRSRRTTSSKAK